MSQKAFMAQFDAHAHSAFADAGLADTGTYTAPTAGATAVTGVRAFVDRATQQIGEFGSVNAGRTEVRYVLADVTPEVGGKFVVDGDTYINVGEIDNDGSLSRWTVRRG